MEDVHNQCFGEGGNAVVHSSAFHGCFEFLKRVGEVGCLNENVLGGFLLFSGLLVEHDENKFGAEEAVCFLFGTFNDFSVAGTLDVADFKDAGHVGRDFFNDSALCLGEVEGIDQVGFIDFLHGAVFKRLFIFHFAFKPKIVHDDWNFEIFGLFGFYVFAGVMGELWELWEVREWREL